MIEALGVGPVDCMGTSGGAVNLLALAAAHPEDIHRAVAHEAPTAAYLPDKEVVAGDPARHEGDLPDPGQRSGDGEVHRAGDVRRRAHAGVPRPARARPGDVRHVGRGRRRPRQPADAQHAVLQRVSRSTSRRCEAFGDRLVHAHGAESGQQLACRGGKSVAALLGVESVEFPSNHGGFLAGRSTGSRVATRRAGRRSCSRSSTPDRRPADADRSPVGRPAVDRAG